MLNLILGLIKLKYAKVKYMKTKATLCTKSPLFN